MRTLFSVFVLSIISFTSFGSDICIKADGCRIDTDTWLCTECVSFDQAPPPKSCIDDNTECISKWGEQYICKQKLYECEQMAIHIMKLEASKKK
tara:strand:+ start:356 stop:637 length:282 start_codon:yes stop_codon:yes gene_type:complete